MGAIGLKLFEGNTDSQKYVSIFKIIQIKLKDVSKNGYYNDIMIET